MTEELTVVALVATYNEEDIIGVVVEDLLANGIQVVILDDGSTDQTVARVEPYLGQGVLCVEQLVAPAEGRGPFSLDRIIARKEELARELDATWFINHDADEFREPCWSGLTLRDGIGRVDRLGYNALDFAVYDFWPTHDSYQEGDDPRKLFPYCEPGRQVDRLQIRCWKKLDVPLDLVSSGGHEAIFPGRRVFPIRFLLRHYAFRSQSHGERKLFRERRPRYDPLELDKGWHVQHAAMAVGESFIRAPEDLQLFDPDAVRADLAIQNRLVEELEARPETRILLQETRSRELDLLSRELDSRNRELQRLHNEVEVRNRQVDRLQSELDTRGREVERLGSEVQGQRSEIQGLQGQRDESEAELADLKSRLERYGGETKRLAKELKARAQESEDRAVELAGSQGKVLALSSELETANRELQQLRQDLQVRDEAAVQVEARMAGMEEDLAGAADALEHTRRRLEDVLSSRSWRWSAPLRALLPGGRRRP